MGIEMGGKCPIPRDFTPTNSLLLKAQFPFSGLPLLCRNSDYLLGLHYFGIKFFFSSTVVLVPPHHVTCVCLTTSMWLAYI